MHELVIVIAKYFVIIPALVWIYVGLTIPKQARKRFIIISAASAILAAILVKVGTTVHQDPRPFVRDHVTPYFTSSTDNGFPSDHTAFSALIAFIVICFRPKIGYALVFLAVIIGASRVISGVHHGQDIIGGFIFGAAAVGIIILIERLIGTNKKNSSVKES